MRKTSCTLGRDSVNHDGANEENEKAFLVFTLAVLSEKDHTPKSECSTSFMNTQHACRTQGKDNCIGGGSRDICITMGFENEYFPLSPLSLRESIPLVERDVNHTRRRGTDRVVKPEVDIHASTYYERGSTSLYEPLGRVSAGLERRIEAGRIATCRDERIFASPLSFSHFVTQFSFPKISYRVRKSWKSGVTKHVAAAIPKSNISPRRRERSERRKKLAEVRKERGKWD